MKQRIALTITAILLITGIVFAPFNAMSAPDMTASKTRQMQKTPGRQAFIKALFTSEYLPKILSAGRGGSNGIYRQGFHVMTANRGKYPALLWHRISLTPQPVVSHWLMIMWNVRAARLLQAIEA